MSACSSSSSYRIFPFGRVHKNQQTDDPCQRDEYACRRNHRPRNDVRSRRIFLRGKGGGIKPIIGLEGYLSKGSMTSRDPKEKNFFPFAVVGKRHDGI